MTFREILNLYKSDNDPNFIGEALRDWAFTKDGYGCYANFDLIPEFIYKGKITEREFKFLGFTRDPNYKDEYWGWDDKEVLKRATWYIHKDNGIEVIWYWDGDGILAFHIPETNQTVYNSDCKHDDEWEFLDSV